MIGAFLKRRSGLALLVFLFAIVAIGIRLNRLTIWPLSLDESYSAFGAANSFDFIWNVLPTYETHPPFYTALLRVWTLAVGNSLFGLRIFGVLIGLLTLAVVWFGAIEMARLSRRSHPGVAFPALTLAAVLPAMVDMTRFVRPYSLLILAYAVGIWAVLRLTTEHRDSGDLARRPWFAYLASLPLLIWLHNLGALYVFALVLALIVLIGPGALLRNHWRKFVVGHAIALVAALPALLLLRDQAGTWVQSTWLAFNPASLPFYVGLIFGWHGIFGVAAGLCLASIGLFYIASTNKSLAGAVLILALLPIILSILISYTIAPVFLVRTLIASTVAMILVMAVGASAGRLPRALLGIWLVFQIVTNIQIQQHAPDQNWYGSARWLAAHMGPQDVVYAYPNEGALPLRFALRDLKLDIPIRDIPAGIPAHDRDGWYPTGSRGVQSLTPKRLMEIADDKISRATPTIWLLRYNKRLYDKNDIFLGILTRERTEVSHFLDRDIDIREMRLPTSPSH